jgi:Heavy metal binding domain
MPPEATGAFFSEVDHMNQKSDAESVYVCPMHSDIRQPNPGKCPKCGMALLPEGTRFGLLRHITSSPLHLIVMAVLMITVMAAAMMMLR